MCSRASLLLNKVLWKALSQEAEVRERPVGRKKTFIVICEQYVFLENSEESTNGILNDEFSSCILYVVYNILLAVYIYVNKEQLIYDKLIKNYRGNPIHYSNK